MVELVHDLKLSVLIALILVHFLDGDYLSGFRNRCLIGNEWGGTYLEDNSERTVTYDSVCVISKTFLKVRMVVADWFLVILFFFYLLHFVNVE